MATGDVKKLRKALEHARTQALADNIEGVLQYLSQAYAYTHRDFHASAETSRKPGIRVTAAIRDRIKPLNNSSRIESTQEIADRFGLGSGGRVSEIWAGEYDTL
jgi:hypothetical protein